jgi:hypothetical protein
MLQKCDLITPRRLGGILRHNNELDALSFGGLVMDPAWAAIIAAGAAIVSSALTSFLSHRFEQRRRSRDYELQWLEERFAGALSFLGAVVSAVGATPNTPEGRKQLAERIHTIVDGPTREANSWFIAVMLDPENTGLRRHVFSAMAYARIEESAEAFTRYWAEVAVSLEALANEYSRQRQALIAGKSLHSLIMERKTKAEEDTRSYMRVIEALKTYLDGRADIEETIAAIRRSPVRGATLALFLRPPSTQDPTLEDKLRTLRRECEARGWIAEHPPLPANTK